MHGILTCLMDKFLIASKVVNPWLCFSLVAFRSFNSFETSSSYLTIKVWSRRKVGFELLNLPQPLQGFPSFLLSLVSQKPYWRLRDELEDGDDSNVHYWRNGCHISPIEVGSQTITKQDSNTNHQGKEWKKGSSSGCMAVKIKPCLDCIYKVSNFTCIELLKENNLQYLNMYQNQVKS